jgi:ribonuclease-3
VPQYHLRREGPDHAPRFFARVSVASRTLGEGQGRSKRQAEVMAAQVAWRALTGDGEGERKGPDAGVA